MGRRVLTVGVVLVLGLMPHPLRAEAGARAKNRIVFTSYRDSVTKAEVYVMNDDGSGVVRLTNDSFYAIQPAPSPDGRQIAFITNRGDEQELYIMGSDGSRQRSLSRSPEGLDLAPEWSPDGKRIAFTIAWPDQADVYVVNPDGSGLRNVTRTQNASEYSPTWTPDGRSLAFVRLNHTTQMGPRGIFRLDASGKRLVRLTAGDDWDPQWSPDGTELAFTRFGSGDPLSEMLTDIYVLDTRTSRVRNLTDTPYQTEYYPSWSPTGKTIAFGRDPDYVWRDDYPFGPSLPDVGGPLSAIHTIDTDGANERMLTSGLGGDDSPSYMRR